MAQGITGRFVPGKSGGAGKTGRTNGQKRNSVSHSFASKPLRLKDPSPRGRVLSILPSLLAEGLGGGLPRCSVSAAFPANLSRRPVAAPRWAPGGIVPHYSYGIAGDFHPVPLNRCTIIVQAPRGKVKGYLPSLRIKA
jgi:hypothetical protein